MSLCRYFARRVPGFRLQSVRGVIGAREGILRHAPRRPWTAYTGPFADHTLLVVYKGIVSFTSAGCQSVARAGDALLIPRGQGGVLEFGRCSIAEKMVVDVMTFDERSIARYLRVFATMESLAVDEPAPPPAIVCHRFTPGFDPMANTVLAIDRYRAAITGLLEQYRPGLAGLFREHFYMRRWLVAVFMERHVTQMNGDRIAMMQYAGGEMQLRRDCKLYLGAEPKSILTRRRCEVATAWLRCGHSVDDVAKALNYASRWHFECEYSGVTHRRCREIQEMAPLAEVEPEELIRAMRPFWWGDRKLAFEPPAPGRIFSPDLMSEAEEALHLSLDPDLAEAADRNRKARDETAQELRERAADFFAMKSTGADVIAPIFGFAKPHAVAA